MLPDLSPRDVAGLSGCSYHTVLREIRRGNLRAFYRGGGGRMMVRAEDYELWAYGRPVVPEAPVESRPARVSRVAGRMVARLDEIERRAS